MYKTEEIVGSMKLVKEFAQFHVNHKEDLKTIYNSYLLDYCDTQTFTPEELKAFRLGLDMFQKFFESAEADAESYLMEAEKENVKKSVG